MVLTGPFGDETVLDTLTQICSKDYVYKDQGLCEISFGNTTRIILEIDNEDQMNSKIFRR